MFSSYEGIVQTSTQQHLLAVSQVTVSLSVFSPSSRQLRSVGRSMLKSSSVSGEIYTQERTDGSQSDTALGTVGGGSKKRRSSLSARVVAIVGNRRSRSTSQISGPGELEPETDVCVSPQVVAQDVICNLTHQQ